jgi:hypothetical protein
MKYIILMLYLGRILETPNPRFGFSKKIEKSNHRLLFRSFMNNISFSKGETNIIQKYYPKKLKT